MLSRFEFGLMLRLTITISHIRRKIQTMSCKNWAWLPLTLGFVSAFVIQWDLV